METETRPNFVERIHERGSIKILRKKTTGTKNVIIFNRKVGNGRSRGRVIFFQNLFLCPLKEPMSNECMNMSESVNFEK